MTPEDKKVILAALRSGKFKQGKTGRLHCIKDDIHYFCVMGVICHALGYEAKPVWFRNSDGKDQHYSYDGYTAFPSQKIQERLGIDATGTLRSPVINPKGIKICSLVGMSDGGFTFLEIAEVIEKQF